MSELRRRAEELDALLSQLTTEHMRIGEIERVMTDFARAECDAYKHELSEIVKDQPTHEDLDASRFEINRLSAECAKLREENERLAAQVAHWIEDREECRRLLYELLFAVERKWPGESRHQTALRYIREAESRAREPVGALADTGAEGRG